MAGPDIDELLRLLKGSPQPELNVQALAQRTGASIAETESALERLESEGRLRRDGDRLIVVEPAASRAPEDERIP